MRHSILVIAVVLIAGTAFAQKPPMLGYVYPPGVPTGKATSVQFGGFDFTSDMQWFVHDDRVRLQTDGVPGDYHLPPPPFWTGPRTSTPALPIPREIAGSLDVDQSAPTGLVRWQVANANGSSAAGVFYVSRGPEIVESRSRDFPQRLPSLPVAVSGRLSRLTEVDRYELVADQDGPISVDLFARRLGSDFQGVLQVRDPAGNLLTELVDTQGIDGGVTFTGQAGKIYIVSVQDVDFRGDRAYVYRLAIARGPRVVCTIPAYGQRGSSREVEFVGVGVASGQPVWESIRQVVAFPPDSTLITSTTSLATSFGTIDVSIPLSDLEEITRPAASATPLTVTARSAITNVLPVDTDEQRYTWQVEKDESWSIDLQSRAIGGRLDMALEVLDPDGKSVGVSDDLPGTPDAALEFRAATSGVFTCVVRSITLRVGTPDEVYRLQIQRRPPDFSLTVPQQINLPLGGKADVTVQLARLGGFKDAVALSVEGLPEGVTAQGDWTIPADKNELKVALQSAPDAAVVARPIQFRGAATIGEANITRHATAIAAGNLCPRSPVEQRVPVTLLAMTMPAPFDVLVIDRERQHDVHRGTTFLADLEIVRKDGFAGEIQIEMSAQQARYRCGIRGPIINVPPDQTRVLYPCFMPEWLGTELTRRMVVHGVALIPDPKGNLRQLTKPGDARITMILEGALLKLAADASERKLQPGESFDLPVSILRSAKLPLPATIELVVPKEIEGLIHAKPLTLAPSEDRGVLHIESTTDARLAGPWTLKVTATALQEDRWPVVSETDFPLTFVSGAE